MATKHQSPRDSDILHPAELLEGACPHCRHHCIFGRERVRLVDRKHRIVWANGEVRGAPLAELLGSRVDDICVPGDRELVTIASQEVLHRGNLASFLVRDKWELRWWLVHVSPALSVGGEIGAVCQVWPVCKWFFDLSVQQRRILSLLANGSHIDSIAKSLGVGQNTIRTQLLRARRTIRCDDLPELLRWSIHHRDVLRLYKGSQVL